MNIKYTLAILAALLVSLPAAAYARPDIKVNMTAEKEIVVEEQGQQVRKRVTADAVQPGQTLIYTINYRNVGDSAANAVVVDNPVPKDTVYVAESAWGSGTDISFSVDAGKTFNNPNLLMIQQTGSDGRTRETKAAPEQYSHVRWNVHEIPAGGKGQVGFHVLVK